MKVPGPGSCHLGVILPASREKGGGWGFWYEFLITKICKNCAGGNLFRDKNLCGRNMKQCNIEETLVNFLTVAQFLKVYR